MPLIDYVRYEDAPERVREALADSAYADAEDRHLFYELLSNNPSLVAARAEYFGRVLADGAVPRREKELAYFAVGLVTDTRFVAATHGRYLVDDHGVPESTVAAIARGDLSGLDERERAVVAFARAATRDPDGVSASDFAALFDAGYDDGDAVELLVWLGDARTATTVVSATGMSLGDRGEADPGFLPASFGL